MKTPTGKVAADLDGFGLHVDVTDLASIDILSGNRPPAIAKGTFRDAPDRLLAIPQDARTP